MVLHSKEQTKNYLSTEGDIAAVNANSAWNKRDSARAFVEQHKNMWEADPAYVQATQDYIEYMHKTGQDILLGQKRSDEALEEEFDEKYRGNYQQFYRENPQAINEDQFANDMALKVQRNGH